MDGKYRIFNDLSRIRSNSNKVLYVSLILTFVSTILNIYYTYRTNESARNSFYLLDKGQKLAVVRIKDYKRAVDILCEGHIANFHELFFALGLLLVFLGCCLGVGSSSSESRAAKRLFCFVKFCVCVCTCNVMFKI